MAGKRRAAPKSHIQGLFTMPAAWISALPVKAGFSVNTLLVFRAANSADGVNHFESIEAVPDGTGGAL
jgi:hypothetical protein